MNKIALALTACLFAVSPVGARPPAIAPPVQRSGQILDTARLGTEIDRSLHWLRNQQQRDGGYGSVAATARTLLALASSPRRYRVSDGPFVARAEGHLLASQNDDGSFSDADMDKEERSQTTLAALRALEQLGDKSTRTARGRAAAQLGFALPLPTDADPRAKLPTDSLLDRASEILLGRAPNGSWDESVERTATRIIELNGLHSTLKSRPARRALAQAQPLPAFTPATADAAKTSLERGARFLLGESSAGRWGFDGRADPGITAMVVGALLAAPRTETLANEIDRALDWLISHQKPDGSIHAGQLANYVTSATVMALARRGREADRDAIARARDFLLELQADGGEGYARGDRYYGGVGYGGDERPDLSNLQMALDALRAAGVDEDDEAFKNALVFLQRCQNRSESNDLELTQGDTTTRSGEDGGAGYAPGESKAGFIELSDGQRVPRSYGSMTYALLKGYLLAGLKQDDPRVEAVWRWLTAHYTLDINPGFEASSDQAAAYQGFFYYLLAMARALDLYGAETVVDAGGDEHPWRAEMIGRLIGLQRQDGSWINTNAARWYEGNPVLATAYAMLALDAARGRGQ